MPDPATTSPVTASAPAEASETPASAAPATAGSTSEAGAAASPEAAKSQAAAKSRAISRELAARKALNAERAAIVKERQSYQEALAKAKSHENSLEEFKKDPLTWAEKNGVTYEEMTKRAIGKHGESTPESRIEAIESKLKADAAESEKQRINAEQNARQAETQRKIDGYIAGISDFAKTNLEAYELLGSLDGGYQRGLIFDVADEYAKRTGKVLSPKEACDMIENYLVEEGVKLAKTKKVGAKIAPPAPVEPENEVPITNKYVQQKIDKEAHRRPPTTLTNRNAASPTRKEDLAAPPRKMTRKEALQAARDTVWGNKG